MYTIMSKSTGAVLGNYKTYEQAQLALDKMGISGNYKIIKLKGAI